MRDDPFKRLAQRADRKHWGGAWQQGLQSHKHVLFRDKQVFGTDIYEGMRLDKSRVIHKCRL